MSTPSYTPSLASTLFAQSARNPPPWLAPTSCRSIDDVLLGGFPHDCVTSISGSDASTRTLIAIHTFVTHLISDPTTEATWVDSSGSFPSDTLKELLQGRALDRAKITRVFDQIGIVEVIDEIKNEHRQREKEEESGGEQGNTEVPYSQRTSGDRLVVIDNITGPYTAMVSRNQLQGQAMLVTIQRGLAALARDYGVAVLLLNDAPRNSGRGGYKHSILRGEFEDASLRLLNGPTYAYGVDLHVLLSRHPEKKGEAVNEDGPDNVFEVLVDRCGGRGGRWAPFRAVGSQLLDW